MGRCYSASFAAVSVSALQDIFEVTAAATNSVTIHGWSLAQTTLVGNANEAVLLIEARRFIGSASGSGGASVTPQPIEDGSAAATSSVERNNTAPIGDPPEPGGSYGWTVREPWVHFYTAETRPVIAPGDRWVLANPTFFVSGSIALSGTLWFEEHA